MTVIQLKHFKKLRYPSSTPRNLPRLTKDVVEEYRDATIVTFRPLEKGRPNEIRRNFHACTRTLDFPKTDMVFVGLEADSSLAPLIFWDAAHALPVGRRITVLHESRKILYLEQDYYRDSLIVESKDASKTVFIKKRPLPAEKDSGLDRWTFGIPVGPEDATLLNVAVRRILELDIPEKEIILCGRPGNNFKYFDKVRIVGEDISAPPVKICAKKNRIANEASYENLCIMHDRVFLPRNFYSAINRFGDNYPLTAFQSIYFDDRLNMVARRYSDFNTAPKVLAQSTRGLMRDNKVESISAFAPGLLAITEEAGFFYANPLRHSRANYPTGSLYICKKSVWNLCPQDENLHWTEFEDIDHGFRADEMGIPSRVNPHAITQSLISRPLLANAGEIHFEDLGGMTRSYRSAWEPLIGVRKPLLKATEEQGRQSLEKFAATYVPESLRNSVPSNSSLSTRLRLKALIKTVQSSRVPIQRKAIDQFLASYEKQMVYDQLPYGWKEWAREQVLKHGSSAITDLVSNDRQLLNHASLRPNRAVFARSMTDYLPKRGIAVRLGSLLSAVLLAKHNKRVFYFPGNVFNRYKAIIDSTPFIEYTEELP